jgi:hypothetical protein
LLSGRFKSTYYHLGVIASASEAEREAIQKKHRALMVWGKGMDCRAVCDGSQ